MRVAIITRATANAVVVAGVLASPAADGAACSFPEQGTGRVTDVIDIRTIRMSDGAEIRLAGIEPAPGQTSAVALAALVAGHDVTLQGDSDAPDRYGRQSAVVLVGAGNPVQLQLLADGAAMASGTMTDRACAAELSAAEAAARRARRGIWAHDGVIKKAVIPGDILAELGRFVVVEGRVVSVREAGATTYLNFGRRWTRDFAVTISRRMMAAFKEAGITQKTLENRRVRVRGWVEGRGGPRIEARYLGQIEVVGDDMTTGRE
jgi:endonuclease YncB( thermonuclease family)